MLGPFSPYSVVNRFTFQNELMRSSVHMIPSLVLVSESQHTTRRITKKTSFIGSREMYECGLESTFLRSELAPEGLQQHHASFSLRFLPFISHQASRTYLVCTPNTNSSLCKFEVVELVDSFEFVVPICCIWCVYSCHCRSTSCHPFM